MFPITQTIFLDISNFYVPEFAIETAKELIQSSLGKVQNAFAGSNIEFVLEQPTSGDYSTLYLNNINNNADSHLGIAEFDQTFNPNDNGIIRLDNIIDKAYNNNLPLEKASNLIASTITHETGHLMGLDHTTDPSDIMHNGLTDNMWENPPSFTSDQLQAINTNAVISNFNGDDINLENYDDQAFSENSFNENIDEIAMTDNDSLDDFDTETNLDDIDEIDSLDELI